MKEVKVQLAAQPRNQKAKIAAWVYAGILVVMAVGQLYSFEKFIPLIEGYSLPGGAGTATLVACLLVTFAVFALPFLLRMPLSPLMRWVSLVSSIAVALLWALLGIIAILSSNSMANSGLLGVKVEVPFGAIQLLWSVALLLLAAWSAWGLWPSRTK